MTDFKHRRPKVLISGANGFVGSHVAEQAAERGWEVYAGMRSSSDPSNLEGISHTRFDLDMMNTVALRSSMEEAAEVHGGFDFIVHCAGVTKPRNHDEFVTGNAHFTNEFATISRDTQPGLSKFVYISSIAALGPGDPVSMDPIDETQTPRPFTPYGKSKLLAEQLLAKVVGLDYVILRPSAVYGPRDAKFLDFIIPLFKRGVDFRLGPSKQQLSFIHVSDLARAILEACVSTAASKTFNISDGKFYGQEALGEAVMEALGVQCRTVRVPARVLTTAGRVIYTTMSFFGKEVHLSHNKMKEVTAANWKIDTSLFEETLNYTPHYDLKSGIWQTLQGSGNKKAQNPTPKPATKS